MESVLTTKVCTRCMGTGRHSFNLLDKDVCYGCGGIGKIPMTPKGQKKIKPTCDNYERAKIGDIVEIKKVLYSIQEIRWIKTNNRRNQQMKVIRLVDGETFIFWV